MIDVYLWLYHIDLWHEFSKLLYPIKDNIVLHLGLYNGHDNTFIVKNIDKQFNHYQIKYHNNIGADILPFITDFSQNESRNSHFLKIHSKKSTLARNTPWRTILLHSLIGTSDIFYSNHSSMLNHDHGIVCDKNLTLRKQENTNSFKILELLNYYGIPSKQIVKKQFAAGSMFFGNSGLFEKFFNKDSLKFLTSKLSTEVGYITDINSGKYAHSLERIFGYISEYENKTIGNTIYPTKRIINHKSPTHKLHLVQTHTSFCYIQENITVKGRLLHQEPDSFTIEWHHTDKPTIRKYVKIDNNTYIGI